MYKFEVCADTIADLEELITYHAGIINERSEVITQVPQPVAPRPVATQEEDEYLNEPLDVVPEVAEVAPPVVKTRKKRTTKAKSVPPFGSMPPEQYKDAIASVTPPPPPPPIASMAVIAPMLTVAAPVKVEPLPTIPQPGAVSAHSYGTFKNNLTSILAQLINEKKIDQGYINELKTYFGIKEIWNITSSEKQTLELYNLFGQLGFITLVD